MKKLDKTKRLRLCFTAEMFEDLSNALDGINKRTLMGSTYQYEDGRLMRVRYLEDNTLQIELYK